LGSSGFGDGGLDAFGAFMFLIDAEGNGEWIIISEEKGFELRTYVLEVNPTELQSKYEG
jgi:hypothetical protein